MKLRKLHIEDYKMFKDFDISFVDKDDKPLNIIVLAGVNGSGKTTLLEYINDAYNIIRTPYGLFSQHVRDKDELSFEKNKAILFDEYLKLNYTNIQVIEKEANNDIEEMEERRKKNLPTIIEARSMIAPLKYHYTQNMKYHSVDTNLSQFKSLLPNYIKDMIYNDDKKPFDAYVEIEQFIQAILKDFNMQVDFDKRDGEGNLFFKNKQGVRFSIDDLSTGEKTLLSKVLNLFFQDYKEKVILIDEPELSLHPSWQNKVLKIYENFAKQNECQIIIATHSPHIITSAKNEYLRILRKNEEGNIEVVNDLKAHGRDINSILFEVMGEVAYRPKEFEDKIDRLHIAIDDKKIEEAKERLEVLKKDYGENDEVVMEAQILIDMFSRNEE